MKLYNLVKFTCLSFAAFQGLQTQALEAAPLTPEFSMEKSSEGLGTYILGDLSKSKWVVPYFFTSKLDCAKPNLFSSTVLCKLDVMNMIDQEQKAYIDSFQKPGHVKVFMMNDINPFVSKIQEGFEIDDESIIPEGSMPTGSGQLGIYGNTHSYQSIYLRVVKSDFDEFKKRFESENGLGIFKSSFEMRAFRYYEHLRVDLSRDQMADLKKNLGKNLSYNEKIQKVSEWLRTAEFISSHLTSMEAHHISELFLRKLTFDHFGSLLTDSLIGDSVVLIDEMKSIKAKCWARVSLSKEAKAKVSCEELRAP